MPRSTAAAAVPAERPAPRSSKPATSNAKPSARQVYAICHVMTDILELEWPADRVEASALLQRLMATRDGADAPRTTAPAAAPSTSDAIPF